MKIAIPLSDNNGKKSRISLHFGHVKFMAIYDSERDQLDIIKVKEIDGCSPIAAIENLDIDMIYCFGMGMRAIMICKEKGIRLKTGRFEVVEDVIENLNDLNDLKESCGH